MTRHASCIALLLLLAACDSLPSWMGGAEKEIIRLPGEREDVLGADIGFKPDEIVQQVSFKVPPALENSAWAQATGQFTALTGNIAAKGDLSSRQSASVGEGNEFVSPLVPRPVVDGGMVFAMDAEGYISAHDVNDISHKIWTSPALVVEDAEMIGGGLAADGGKLYATSGLGRVAALDVASGAELWHRDLLIPLRSSPRVAEGKIFAITIDSQLYALDATTGTILWTHRGIGETAGLMNNVSPAIAAGAVIVPYASGELYALRGESGDEIWRESLAQARRTEATAIFSGIGGDPVVDEAVVFAVSNSGLFSVFNVLNGQTVWERKIASINTPWLVGEYVYLLTEDNVLMAMVKYDGRIRWTTQLKRYGDEKHKLLPIVWRGPVMVDGKILVVSSDGEMVQVDGGSGSILSTEDVPDEISTAPVVAAGKVFLVDKDATLYAYQ
ncbi:MAG: PQQ-binding-like beta-propeller repeat protein [Alphaproteobacteria bacterium]|nr:PQQ-binding-like beta-propeller repeat protein [Alphaproteobacteria bacterium]